MKKKDGESSLWLLGIKIVRNILKPAIKGSLLGRQKRMKDKISWDLMPLKIYEIDKKVKLPHQVNKKKEVL